MFPNAINHLKHIEQLSKKPKSAICTMHEGKSNKTPLIHKKTVIQKLMESLLWAVAHLVKY